MNRGEVWLINLDPTVGAEIKKTRPDVIGFHCNLIMSVQRFQKNSTPTGG